MEPLTRHQEALVHRRDVLRSLDVAIPLDLEAALAAEGIVDFPTDYNKDDTTNG